MTSYNPQVSSRKFIFNIFYLRFLLFLLNKLTFCEFLYDLSFENVIGKKVIFTPTWYFWHIFHVSFPFLYDVCLKITDMQNAGKGEQEASVYWIFKLTLTSLSSRNKSYSLGEFFLALIFTPIPTYYENKKAKLF